MLQWWHKRRERCQERKVKSEGLGRRTEGAIREFLKSLTILLVHVLLSGLIWWYFVGSSDTEASTYAVAFTGAVIATILFWPVKEIMRLGFRLWQVAIDDIDDTDALWEADWRSSIDRRRRARRSKRRVAGAILGAIFGLFPTIVFVNNIEEVDRNGPFQPQSPDYIAFWVFLVTMQIALVALLCYAGRAYELWLRNEQRQKRQWAWRWILIISATALAVSMIALLIMLFSGWFRR